MTKNWLRVFLRRPILVVMVVCLITQCIFVNGSIDCVDNGVCIECQDLEMVSLSVDEIFVGAKKLFFDVSHFFQRIKNIVKTLE